ncbi:MAG: efflux RND transporter periplasmic adaptor subunit [Thiohalocapsa sp.]|jgi:RND family efflux transporter MFP subunit|uniref:efflux RND transporter periplasmic adaptor subunit n=1 Tax=Thiohalocapsa sp. TaxID=2497641 RepID=UPI0025E66FF6|nr:efflux RND transporter periplasmic adaptor subunit [Thiohalocapsa sp.]MCG6940446.1 efflux RND transporter periplasmic adaptor subunit [Thiohalocapsa sp.]
MLLAGCQQQSEDAGGTTRKPSAAKPRAHLVTTYLTERAPVSTQHERPGTLRLRRLVRVHAREEGRVQQLDVFEGDQVDRGALLVRLDDALLRLELDKARATLAQKRIDLKRYEDLAQRDAASQDELAQARTALVLAEADLSLLETRLDYTRIAAPFAGVIIERLGEPGDFIAKNTHLLTLADPASLVAEVYVSELVLPHIAVGDPARIRIDALGGRLFAGHVLRIHPTLSEANRQAEVEIRFDQIPAGARAGQFVRAELSTAAVPRLLVPFRALRQDRDGTFVWVIDHSKAARRPVRTGIRIADQVEILDGLTPGQRVITRGFLGLSEGKQVERVDDDDGPSIASPGAAPEQVDSMP